MANNIKSDDEAQKARKKALYITMLGHTTFVKLCDLASPNVNNYVIKETLSRILMNIKQLNYLLTYKSIQSICEYLITQNV